MISSGIWDPSHANYAAMIFKYAYDSRGRMTSKTVPSGGTTSIAYDRLDRPVLSTDAKGFKVFTRYDILSRPIVSGKYKGAGVPGAADPLFETPNTTAPHYYTSTSFPTDNNLDVYKVFYYDDYDLDNNGSLGAGETYTDPAESGYDAAAFLRTRGKPSASKVGILLASGLAPTTFLTTRSYYDKEYSVIQVNKQNHLGGSDISSNAYDFANRVTKTRRHHTATPPGGSLKTYYIREEYAYDDASRLRFTRHSIKTTASLPAATDWVITSAPLFDELNRLQEKRLHMSNFDGSWPVNLSIPPTNTKYLQNLDYTYNIRGWLTGINDPTSCATQSGDDLPDLFSMGLDYESTANGATAQYNGNIAAMQWRSNVNGSCLTRQQYRFTYDYANRLLTANHFTHNGTAWTNTNNYSESGISYDLNGNLKGYTRRGLTAPGTFGVIDQLTYAYGDAARPDRLTNMTDAGSATKGFRFTSGAAAYAYDLNGNLTQDNHKSLTFQYNYLNLANYISDAGGADMTITYTADGEKLSKVSSAGTRNYVSGIEYLGSALEAIYHSEGRCTPNGASAFYYEYTIKDHLGNARVNFRANGAAITFLQELHYYPFGMIMEGIGTAKVTDNAYKYNSKELNEDLGLNLSDYGARWYDAALGRWWSVDPLGEKGLNISSYAYVSNNPLILIDPTGMESEAYSNGLSGLAEETREKSRTEVQQRDLIRRVNKAFQSIVHVLALPGSDKKIVEGAIKTANEFIATTGLNTKVKRENVVTFNIKKMPLTDAVAVIGGTKNESADFILNKIDHNFLSEQFQRELAPGSTFRTDDASTNPEKSDGYSGWGYVIATSTQGGSANKDWGIHSMDEFVGFSIFHGMGHLAGILHLPAFQDGGQYENGFMDSGSHLKPQMINYYKGDINRMILDTKHNFPELVTKIKNRYGG